MIPYFSLRKPKRTLRQIHRLYNRKEKSLDEASKDSIRQFLKNLQGAILQKNPAEAKRWAQELQTAATRLMPKNRIERVVDFLGGILVALLVAVLIRTMWFELYTIPTGSMRPTLKEEDYLIVSKTDYGINVPLKEAHFYFDPNLVKRGSIVVFNGANIDISDADTTYFYLFPGKKQFVKRLIGKPGDTLYFYGGQIYGVDAEGHELTDLKEVNQIEHIPFIRWDGKAETLGPAKHGIFPTVLFHQMNEPIAKLSLTPIGTLSGEMLPIQGKAPLTHYSDFLGMKHFAMARLLTRAQVEKIHEGALTDLEEGALYLELTHHATLQGAQVTRDEYHRLRPELAVSTSLIPLQQEHLSTLLKQMTTCRFIVKDGVASRQGWNQKELAPYLPRFSEVPDGTYEFQAGKAYRLPFPTLPIIGLFTNGYTQELPATHPLYQQSPENIAKLYNLGIELLNQYAPVMKGQRTLPSRYAYFKEGDLYLLGAPLLKKGDPTLAAFEAREQQRRLISTSLHPYFPFVDSGKPSLEEIRKYGIHIPEKMYLVLGDNHAMSADSRQFGFVPEENLKGGVSFLFAPPGERWGRAPQPSISHLTFPNVTVWTLFLLTALLTSLYYRRQLHRSL